MIAFKRLERKGNLGNQLFQIASVIGIANDNNTSFMFPKWKYSDYFKNQLPILEIDKKYNFIDIEEENSTFQKFKLEDTRNYDIDGWLQSEKYFDINKTKHFFQFNDQKINAIKEKYKLEFSKKTILISIRRGDFVDHPDFYQLSIKYYINALITYFPDWENYTIFVFSDDIKYSKFHFGDFENCIFNDSKGVMEQLMIASLCNHFIISNSTFSWWCAWLGEKNDSKIIRPKFYFSESKRKINNDVDYFPERWITFCHENTKLQINTNRFVFKNNEKLKVYYENYFEYNSLNNLEIIEIYDTIIPPLLLYIVLKKRKNHKIYYHNVSYISSKKEFDLFSKHLDFGLFSTIFKFKKSNRKSIACVVSFDNYDSKNETILRLVGKISNLKGNSFLFLNLKSKILFKTKNFIKKILPLNLVNYIKKIK
jgi:hypothetical protein